MEQNVKSIWDKVQKWGFWFLIVFVLGIIGSKSFFQYQYDKRMEEAIQIGGFIHQNAVYQISLRP